MNNTLLHYIDTIIILMHSYILLSTVLIYNLQRQTDKLIRL